MKRNIIRFEFQARLKSTITWSLALTALLLVFFSFYPIFANQAETIDQIMENFPPELRTAFGMSDVNLSSVLGYYSLIFLFVQLCLAVQAANYGFGLVSVEENELTADFLLSKPVSRTQVLTSKLLAVCANLTATNLIVWASSLISIGLFRVGKEFEPRILLMILSNIALFQLFFLSVGLVVSLLVKRVRSVTPYALGLAFGAYVINAFGGVFGDVKLEYITPFKHLDPAFIIQNESYNSPLVLINVIVSITALIFSYWLYKRRDIPAVS